jgi:hypothetical protein
MCLGSTNDFYRRLAHSLMDRIETAYENSPLPALPHKENIEGILVQMREELYG